jgi:hypothetical protein
MAYSPAVLAYLAELREEASRPDSLGQMIHPKNGHPYMLWPEDIEGKSDSEILAFLISKANSS